MKPYKPKRFPRVIIPKDTPDTKPQPEPLTFLSDDEVLNKSYEFARLLRIPIKEIVMRIYEQMQADNYGCPVWGVVDAHDCLDAYFQFCLNRNLVFENPIEDKIICIPKVSLAINTMYGNVALELSTLDLVPLLDKEVIDFEYLNFTQNLISTVAASIADSYGVMFSCNKKEDEVFDYVYE